MNKKYILLSVSLLMFVFSFSQNQLATEQFNSGNEKRKRLDYQGAIQFYTKAIELDANYAKAYYYRGFCEANLNDFEGALADFNKALTINPNSLDAYYNRGIAKNQLKQCKSAIDDFNKSLDIDPNFYGAY